MRNIAGLGFLLICFFTALNAFSFDPDAQTQSIIDGTRPDRSSPWTYTNRLGQLKGKFYEYFVSSKDNECAFVGLGFASRADAIDQIFQQLNQTGPKTETIKKYIQNSIDDSNNPNQSIEDYLNSIKNSTELTCFTQNYGSDGLIPSDKQFTFINALAVLKNVNLHIYEVLDNQSKSLKLSHFFSNKIIANSKTNTILIHKGEHFNRLANIQHSKLNGTYKEQEEGFLRDLADRITSEEVPLNISNSSSDFSDSPLWPSSPILENFAQNEEEPLEAEAQTSVISPAPMGDFAENIYYSYVRNFYETSLGMFSKGESCTRAFAHYENSLESYAPFALARLLIEKKCFADNSSNQQSKIDLVRQKLSSRGGMTPREIHYAQVFTGKLLVLRNSFEEAYKIFSRLREKNKSFTKTYLVDIAELILVYGYIPSNISQEEAYDFAQKILNEIPHQGQRTNRRVRSNNSDILSAGLELNSTSQRDRGEQIRQAAQLERSRLSRSSTSSKKYVNPRYLPHKNTKEREKNAWEKIEADREILNQSPLLPEVQRRSQRTQSSLSGKKRKRTTSNYPPSKRYKKSSNDDIESANIELENDLEENTIDVFIAEEAEKDLFDGFEESEKEKEEIIKQIAEAKYYGRKGEGEKVIRLMLCALKNDKIKNYPDLHASTYIHLGNSHYNNDEALSYIKAIKILKKNNSCNLELLAQAYIGLGSARYTDQEVSNSYDWYLKATEILIENNLPHQKLLARAYIGLGNARYTDQKVRNNYDWYLKATEILEKNNSNSEELLAQAYIGLGHAKYTDRIVMHNSGWYLKAKKILEKNNSNNFELLAQAYIGLGYTMDRKRESWYLEAKKILEENNSNNFELLAQAYIGLGNVKYTDGIVKKDSGWYLKAQKILEENNSNNFELLAQAYIGLGNSGYGNRESWYLKAEKCLVKQNQNNINLFISVYKGLARSSQKVIDVKYYAEKAIELLKKTGDKKAILGMKKSIKFAESKLNNIRKYY